MTIRWLIHKEFNYSCQIKIHKYSSKQQHLKNLQDQQPINLNISEAKHQHDKHESHGGNF